MLKEKFLLDLHKSRKANKDAPFGTIESSCTEKDDELAWRLFQIFPREWTDSQRYQGMCLLIPHMTVFTAMHLFKGIKTGTIVKRLHRNLVAELHYHIAPRYLRIFIAHVKKAIQTKK